ncbi:hypothetical protein ABH922_003653 [Rhodococcus sp. 27YEA15]
MYTSAGTFVRCCGQFQSSVHINFADLLDVKRITGADLIVVDGHMPVHLRQDTPPRRHVHEVDGPPAAWMTSLRPEQSA